MNTWIERFDEELLPNKEAFYINLNMKDTTDVNQRHAKNVFKNFNHKNIGGYHDLYVQNETLLLADVFENFINKCIEIYEIDPAHLFSAPGLAWKACQKKTGIKLELSTDVDKRIRSGICHVIYRYT